MSWLWQTTTTHQLTYIMCFFIKNNTKTEWELILQCLYQLVNGKGGLVVSVGENRTNLYTMKLVPWKDLWSIVYLGTSNIIH